MARLPAASPSAENAETAVTKPVETLTVSGGKDVAVATREAIPGDDLAALEAIVRGRLTADAEADKEASARAEHLRIQAIRQVIGYLRPDSPGPPGGLP